MMCQFTPLTPFFTPLTPFFTAFTPFFYKTRDFWHSLQSPLDKRVGPPHIFHSDNGREFVNQLLHSLLETWSSGNVTFVNGRPCHSQSQGLVERGNRTVQEKIAAIKNDGGWVSWLLYCINTQVNTTTKEMPYKLVFGQYPRSQLIPGAEQHIVNEEEITEITQSSSFNPRNHLAQCLPQGIIPENVFNLCDLWF